LEHFLKILTHHFKINEHKKVLLAVSGGLDSMVLAYLFHKTGFSSGIAHVNFKLRGKDSEKDMELVRKFSTEYNMPFHLLEEDPSALASKDNLSIQMAARRIRYDFFNDLVAQENYDFIATAHHANDHFETALQNLIRGTGFKGLAGIPRINGNIIRPLIHFTRKELEDFAVKHGIVWREDSSNAETKYDRNKIRHQIIPVVEEINEGYIKAFNDTSDQLQLLDMYVENGLEKARKSWILEENDCIRLDIAYLKQNTSELILFWEYLKHFGFNFQQFRDIIGSLDSESGKQFETVEYLLEKDRDFFYLSSVHTEADKEMVTISREDKVICFGKQQMELHKGNGHSVINSDPNEAFLDADKLQFPLRIRNWQPGDRFQPLGMQGQKKLSDFMIDEKIPLNLKRRQKVLLSDNEIVWVLGHRIDHRFRITDKTQNSLHLKLS
jgi:tRNA(Ile)-lysidine synthase